MTELSNKERWLIDKALRMLRDKHYRSESSVSAETYAKNKKIFDQCNELRHRIIEGMN